MLNQILSLALLLIAPPVAIAQTAPPPPGTLEFYHVDALGSVRAISNASGQVIATFDYHPFGEGVGTEIGQESMRFTGKPRDAETGLDYFGARYYTPRLGRFGSVDPVLDTERALGLPQLWNRYAYALNAPHTYVDPDGRNPFRQAAMYLSQTRVGQAIAARLPAGSRIANLPVIRTVVNAADKLEDRLYRFTTQLSTPEGTHRAVHFDLGRTRHVFRDAIGHVNPTTEASRQRFANLFEQVASNPANLRNDAVQAGIITREAEKAGVSAYTWIARNGQQVWVTVRDGVIQNAGVNGPGAAK